MVTVLTLRCGIRIATRVPEREQQRRREPRQRREHFARDRLLRLLEPVHLRADRCEPLGGVVIPTGSSAIIAETRLLYVPRSPGVRTDTGTSVRTTRSVDDPRRAPAADRETRA